MAERDWDRERDWERGRRYRGEGYYGGYYETPGGERDWGRRGDERGLMEPLIEEVRSWFGDEDAERRRDERGPGRGAWGERGQRSGRERGWGEERRGSGGFEEADPDWARQWGYLEGRGRREPERGWSRGWGYGGGYGSGAGYGGGRADWRGSGGYEPGGYGWPGQERAYGGQSRHDYQSERHGSGWRSGVWQGPHVGRGPRGYRRSDERIREDICEQMSQHGELDASDIEIVVVSGEVTLQGAVRERADKRLAEDLAEQVSGVREVNNQLRVGQATGGQENQETRPEGPRYRAA